MELMWNRRNFNILIGKIISFRLKEDAYNVNQFEKKLKYWMDFIGKDWEVRTLTRYCHVKVNNGLVTQILLQNAEPTNFSSVVNPEDFLENILQLLF